MAHVSLRGDVYIVLPVGGAGEMSDLRTDVYAAAAERGQQVVLPKANELFIDIDNDDSYAWFTMACQILDENEIEYTVTQRPPSRSGGEHIYVELTDWELTPLERIAFQAVMGSDRKRELLSLLRLFMAIPRPPTVFFEQEER
jgi:hypothetical protein